MRTVLACVWLMIMSASNAGPISSAVATLPKLPVPPQGELQWVARSMRMNGLPMTIQTLMARSVPTDVIHFYESWGKQEDAASTRRWRTHDTEALSIRTPSYLITIELYQVVNGTQGTVVISSPPERAILNAVTKFPHPNSWRVANLQQYEDDGKETEHILFTSIHTPASEAHAIWDLLAANGWTLINKSATRVADFSLEAQRNSELARVVITDDSDHRVNSLVTVLWSKG